MRSMRNRLTMMLVVGMSVLLVGAGFLISSFISAHLQDEFDRVLKAKARVLITLTEDEGGEVEFDFSSDTMPEFSKAKRQGEPPDYFQLWLESDTRVERSPSLGADNLSHLRLPELDPDFRFHNIELPDERPGRMVQVSFVPQEDEDEDDDEEDEKDDKEADAEEQLEKEQLEEKDDDDTALTSDLAATLIVARSRGQLDALIGKINFFLAILIVALLIIMPVLVRLTLRSGLRPLDDIRHQVSRLDASSLTTGIQLHTQTAELTSVVNQVNALLHRLDAAFTRERQFSSDVAHELRTPLAELRALTEIGGRWPEDQEAVGQYFVDAHAICEQMERVVISLFTLTRCERGVQPVQMAPIQLREIVETSWQSVKQTATEKSQRFECEISPSYTVTSDHDMLLVVLSNLLGNAVLHSAPASVIRCVAVQNGVKTCLTISNPVKDLAAEDLHDIFERFWRKDAARSDGTHSGLGLSIVKAFSDLLSFEIQAHLDEEQEFSISLALTHP